MPWVTSHLSRNSQLSQFSVSVNSVIDLSRFLPFTNVSYGPVAEYQSKIAEHITFLRAIKNPVDVNLRGCLLVEAEVGIEPA
ncbi:hypothetical protein D3C71_654030 [compost metagenome]